jgi:hypothetical protein
MIQKFKAFMLGPFEKALMGVLLHPDIRKMVGWAHQCIEKRRFDTKGMDQSTPKELLVCDPLLRLVAKGIILPIFKDSQSYSGIKSYLSDHREGFKNTGLNNEIIQSLYDNVTMLHLFLSNISEGKYDGADSSNPASGGNTAQANAAAERVLRDVARQVKHTMLKFAKEQAMIEDDTETHTTIDAYTTHYDRTPHVVSIATSDLLRMSNMLKANGQKIRQTDDDPVVKACDGIGEWSEEVVEELSQEENDKLHNLVINNRFILNKGTNPDQPIVVCRASHVPMPPSFCASSQKQYVNRYMVDASNTKLLEELFREIEPIEANKWLELKAELEAQEKSVTGKHPPNFVLVHKLQDGIRKIEELASVDAMQSDLLNEMSDKLLARRRHRTYLEQVQSGLHMIKKAQLDHMTALKQAEIVLKAMVDFAVVPKLPDKILEAAVEASATCRLDKVNKRFEQMKLNRRANLTDCTFAPTATQSFVSLRKDGTIQSLSPDLGGESIQKDIHFTFTMAMDGGCDIEINLIQKRQKFNLRNLRLSSSQLQMMKKSQDGEPVPIPDSENALMVVDASKLKSLMTQISTGVRPAKK